MILLAIDPGPKESAWLFYEPGNIRACAIEDNAVILSKICVQYADWLVIEMVEGMGMPVGRETFETVWWIGRFCQAWSPRQFTRMGRREVKLHLCGSCRAKDQNIRQAVIDKLGAPGTKRNPGVTYGMKSHLWQALGLAIVFSEQHRFQKLC